MDRHKKAPKCIVEFLSQKLTIRGFFMDKSNVDILCLVDLNAQPFLTDLIADDEIKRKSKIKKQNWDTRKASANTVSGLLATGDGRHQKQALRIRECANILQFGWVKLEHDHQLQLKNAYFCDVRNCPICQWRRSRMWLARFFQVFPRIYAAYPTMRYALLTLTVENCDITELRSTTQHMNKAWKRLSERKVFPALGFVRALEVTKETDQYAKDKNGRITKHLIRKARPEYCHPHFHILLALPSSYFGGNYLSTSKWAKLWQNALKVGYTPICHVRVVKPNPKAIKAHDSDFDAILGRLLTLLDEAAKNDLPDMTKRLQFVKYLTATRELDSIILEMQSAIENAQELSLEPILTQAYGVIAIAQKIQLETILEGLQAAIVEVVKYAVKPSDMIQDAQWLLAMVDQMHKTRAISLGGIFKEFLREEEQQDTSEDKPSDSENGGGLYFGWREIIQRYQYQNQKKT